MARRQFRLISLMWCVAIAAIALGCLTAWHRHYRTRHIREFCAAIAVSPQLDSESKAVLTTIAWQPEPWESGLIRRLAGPTAPRHIAWMTTLDCGRGKRKVYLFDASLRPVADAAVPLICVLLDEHDHVAGWSEVAPFSDGFLAASLDGQNVLTVSTAANWFYGKGTYRYQIECDAINELGEGVFSKFEAPPVRERSP